MSSKINILDDSTINQIAAGEVIENGASIVKELVENSIDAGSTKITIEVRGGGRHLIRVTDNGEGMGKEDAILSFERHATSKIRNIADFDQLKTMGFRGEALASIASVSKIKMATNSKEGHEGTLVELIGSRLLNVVSIPCDKGTSLEVTDLFFNAPARKKFLKSPQYDQQEIQKSMLSLILGNPKIDFDLIVDGRKIWEIPLQRAEDFFAQLKQRISFLLHPEIIEALHPIDFSKEGLSIKGFIGKPEVHRPNRSSQYLFLNQRPIQSWLISQGVVEGYGSALPERRHPAFVLHLQIDPKEFDVNVHPQKKEVRFRYEQKLKKMISDAVAACFGVPYQMKFSAPFSYSTESSYSNHTFEKVLKETQSEFDYSAEEKVSFPMTVGLLEKHAVFLESPHLYPRKQGLYLMHLERALDRVYNEKAVDQEKSFEKQILLIPVTLNLSPQENVYLHQRIGVFQSLGFEMHEFAPSSWMVEAFPIGFKESELLSFIQNCLNEENVSLPQKTARYLSKKISKLEVDSLLRSLFKCKQPLYSLKGEAIFSEINAEDYL